jgi:hypothetical protein
MIFATTILAFLPSVSAQAPSATSDRVATEYVTAHVLVTDLGEFDIDNQRYRVGFYIWYEAEPAAPNLLENLRLRGVEEILKNEGETFVSPDGKRVHRRYFEARVDYTWRVEDFPFDQQSLVLMMDLGDLDYRAVRFVGNSTEQVIDPDIEVTGWEITGAATYATRKIYPTGLGHPAAHFSGELEIPELVVTITIRRTTTSGFWKMMATALAAAGLACTAYFIPLNMGSALSPRFGLIAGSVFAVVLSMRQSMDTLGALTAVTLTDQIHIAILIYIGMATVVSLFTHWHFQTHDDGRFIVKVDRRVAIITTMLLAVTILALMREAAQ